MQAHTYRLSACFNSRSREGSDAPRHLHIQGYQGFNSRSREGSDVVWSHPHVFQQVSIHAPARGATGRKSGSAIPKVEFQFTLPRGERQEHAYGMLDELKFQFTLPRGERQ